MSQAPPVRVPEDFEGEGWTFLDEMSKSLYRLWNSVGRPYAPTAAETTVTHTAPGTADYAIQDLTDSSPFGFATKDEGNTVLQVIANLQARVTALEVKNGSIN